MTKTQFLDFQLDTQINVWNKFSEENGWDEYFYENNEYFFNDFYHGSAYKLVEHIHYGDYDFNDNYVYYDIYGLNSFSDIETFHSIIDIDEMLKWYNEKNIGDKE